MVGKFTAINVGAEAGRERIATVHGDETSNHVESMEIVSSISRRVSAEKTLATEKLWGLVSFS